MSRPFTLQALCIGAILIGLSACQTTQEAAQPLTTEEVKATFIGKSWTQGTGDFMFEENGMYSYSDSEIKVHGVYEVAENGILCATNAADSEAPNRRTCFTFYREGDGYKYFHDRTGKYFPATFK